MQICAQWLENLESMYLIRIRGLWKKPDVNDYLTDVLNTSTTTHDNIFDPTGAI